MKACRDCKHVTRNDPAYGSSRPVCYHPQSRQELPNYYEGGKKAVFMSAEMMRQLGACGHDAKLFEPHEPSAGLASNRDVGFGPKD